MYRTVSVFGFLIVFIFCVLYVIEQNNEDFLLTQLGVNPFFCVFYMSIDIGFTWY